MLRALQDTLRIVSKGIVMKLRIKVVTACVAGLVTGLLATLSQSALAQDPPSCRAVHFADIGWTDITSTTALASTVFEGLGYQPVTTVASVPISFAGLKSKQLDVSLGYWWPVQEKAIAPFVESKSINVLQPPNLTGAKATFAVPTYEYDAGLKTFADIAKHRAELDGKIYGIEPGAPANQNIKKMIADKAFGLGDWKIVESSETGMLTQVERAVRDKQWIVFLAWEPHLMNTKFHLTYLSGGDAYFGPNYGGATVNTVTRAGFAGQCTNLAKLFQQMTFNVDMENQIIANLLQNKVDVNTAAMTVLKGNPALLSAWLKGVTTTSGADGLQAVQAQLGIH
jgi:glycine betaine/proline transport system substrate-binding protein